MEEEEPTDKIQWLSQQIEIDPTDTGLIEQRSQVLRVEGRVDEAISDCTKLIHLTESREYYVRRSQLFKSKGRYSQALRDLQTAKSRVRQPERYETASDIYLQNSVCMSHFKQVEQMARIIQAHYLPQPSTNYSQTMEILLQIKHLKPMEAEGNKKQIQELKVFYERQTNQLRELLLAQLKEVKEKVSHVYVDYESRFLKEVAGSGLEEGARMKLRVYFEYLVSEMEKYYIAAKNLHKIEDKTIKFQDFESMVEDKKGNDYLKKMYKLFDKYSSEVSKVEELIQHVPYIGSAFKIVKTSMKAKGWLEHINIQNECENIERVAIHTTSFNEFSTNLAYYLVQHYQCQILNQKKMYKSDWEILALRIKRLKKEKLGNSHYWHELGKEEEVVKEYGVIHASILMIAFACNRLDFDRPTLREVNQEYGRDKEAAMKRLAPVFKVIGDVESALKTKYAESDTPQNGTNTDKDKSTSSSYCCVY